MGKTVLLVHRLLHALGLRREGDRRGDVVPLGVYLLSATGRTRHEQGQSAKKVDDLLGAATEYRVTGPDGADLVLLDTRWNNRDRDVRVVERNQSPPRYDTVIGRLRISVEHYEEDLFMELRQARVGPDGRAQSRVATLQQLDEGAGTSVSGALRDLGARVGTKQDLLGRTDETRERICCRFPPTAELVPAAAFVLTRIAPVGRGYQEPG